MDPCDDTPLRLPDGRRPYVMIDGFNLGLEKGTGVATYARNLTFALRDLGVEVGVLYGHGMRERDDELFKEVAFFDPPHQQTRRLMRLWRGVRAATRSPHSRAFQIPITGSVVADGFRAKLPHFDSVWNANRVFDRGLIQHELMGWHGRVQFQRAPDLQHWTYPFPLRTRGAPNVYTLHDLVPLRLPFTTLDRKKGYLSMLRWIARTADHVVTVSEASRRDIIDLLGMSPDRVSNTYQAVSLPAAQLRRAEDDVRREVEGVHGLAYGDYFLFFGSIEPKKNIGRLIEAYLASDVKRPLVIVGAQAWRSEQELRLIGQHQNGAARRIVQIEYLPLPGLISLIRGARALLFPSLYEGFGLPVLEAMTLGAPVLTSNSSALPEIAGDAALLVDPYDTAAIADGIRALDANDALRADLSARGRIQAAKFSQRAYAQRLAAVYREVLARAGR